MRNGRAITIRLADDLESWLYRQVDAGGFGTPSEYIRHLLRKAQVAATFEQIDAKLVASIKSGPARRVTAKDWEQLLERAKKRGAELRKQHAARSRRRSA